jgi:lysophospholipase L1-like esterase
MLVGTIQAFLAWIQGEKMDTAKKWLAAVLVAAMLVAALSFFLFETRGNAETTVRVACVGDSITHDTNYTDQLGRMLGGNYTVGEFGVGRTTVSLDFNKPYIKQSAYQRALSFEPDIVVIMLGTNDAYLSDGQRSSFVDDYQTLVLPFQDLPSNPEVYVVVPPPAYNNTMGLPPAVLEDQVIPLISQTATDLNLPLIDATHPLLTTPKRSQTVSTPMTTVQKS